VKAQGERGACSPRKRPVQGRSRVTVDALIEATARILARDGYRAATTRRVAEVAGVGVGSLYQYFPSRDALVAAVLERHFDRILEASGRAFAGGAEPAVTLRAFAEALVEVQAGSVRLSRVLAEHAPRLQGQGLLRSLEERMAEQIRAYWAGRGGGGPPFDLERALFVLNHCCAELIRAATLEHPAWVTDGRLAGELHRLIVGYLGVG
jgi:AcrR family transcriptional regulator